MIKRLSILILLLIIECSTFGESIKDVFGEEIACNIDTCDDECENENQEKKSDNHKYLISFWGLNFLFDYFSPKENIYFFTQSAERFPIQLIQSPPPKF